METRLQKLEELVAELTRTVEDLSEITARQTGEIDRLERRVAMLLERAAQAESDVGGAEVFADERPPHW